MATLSARLFLKYLENELTDYDKNSHSRRELKSEKTGWPDVYGQCPLEIIGILPHLHNSIRVTRHSAEAHPFVIATKIHRIVKFKATFLSVTIRLWDRLPIHVLPSQYNSHRLTNLLRLYWIDSNITLEG